MKATTLICVQSCIYIELSKNAIQKRSFLCDVSIRLIRCFLANFINIDVANFIVSYFHASLQGLSLRFHELIKDKTQRYLTLLLGFM